MTEQNWQMVIVIAFSNLGMLHMQDTCIQQHVVCCTLITITCMYRNFATRTHGRPRTAKFHVQHQQRDANMSIANFHVDTCYMSLPLVMLLQLSTYYPACVVE